MSTNGSLRKNWPLLVIFIAALASSVVAGWYTTTETGAEIMLGPDSWGIPFWLTPLGYVLLVAWFTGGGLNKPIFAIASLAVGAASIALLFIPLPATFQWHYIWGVAALIAYFGHRHVK